jgi:hypothetical protein
MSDTRCEDGHRWRHYGGYGNDPDSGETDEGVCPDCAGRGCENKVDEEDLLSCIAQLLDGKRAEGCAWSEWDQEIRDKISRRLRWVTTKPQHVPDEIQF